MACFGWDGDRERRSKNSCFERSSAALQQILLQAYHQAQNPKEIDHHLYEFGSVEYNIKSSASEPDIIYLSISTPILCPRTLVSRGLCTYTKQKIKDICPIMVEILDKPREGYQLTLQLKVSHIPQGKDGVKVIKEIAAIESVILSSQLKEMLHNFSTEDVSEESYKPIKLLYRPREPLFVIRQTQKITVVFPMKFKETSDVMIAMPFFQELMDAGNTEALAKAPQCTWSPIPPPELRGELIEDLSTNGGFISFDISARHVDDKRLDETIWSLLNFPTYVKSHVKSTKGLIQRKLRKRLEELVKMLHEPDCDEDEQELKLQGCGWKMKSISFSRLTKLRKRYGEFNNKVTRIRYRIKIQGFSDLNRKIKRIHQGLKTRGFAQIRSRWFSIPKFHSAKRYTKLEQW